MGKHERDIVEKAEKIIVKLINKSKLEKEEFKHPFLKLIYKFITHITNEYSDIEKAEHIGNKYNSLGDIKLKLKNGEIKYIELKFLNGGKGTLANISQDSLTTLGIYDCESWSDFRKRNGHQEKICNFLNGFKYPNSSEFTLNKKNTIYNKAEYLKKIIGPKEKNIEKICKEIVTRPTGVSTQKIQAAKIILNIIDYDKKIRILYLDLLSSEKYNKKILKKFCILLIMGVHNNKELGNLIFQSNLKIPNNYLTYYLYKNNLKIIKEDNTSLIKKILTNDIEIDIKKEQTNLVVNSVIKTNKISIIRIVYHWKNKFQGIQTPCLNIFHQS